MKKLVLAALIYITLLTYFGDKSISKVDTSNKFKGELISEKIEFKQKTMKDIFDDIDKFKEEQELKKKQEEDRKRELEIIKIEKEKRVIQVEISAYCQCVRCCGEWAYKNPGITASGTKARWGTIAAPKELKFGTKMKIKSFGDKIFTCEDTGSYIKKVDGVYRLDIWVENHSKALKIGRYRDVAEIIN